jgi:D-alanyl-D-alanine carboxypeptidase (penicillin-binding protein 5/6)
VLLVTVMHPEKNDHNEVYKEAAKLLDWGFKAAGKATPVGALVAPKSAQASAQPGASGQAGGAGDPSGKPVASDAARGGSGGRGVALAIAGGVLVLLAAATFLVNRRWPLPDLVRRRTRP